MAFKNRFVTERDEAVFNDCTVCSFVMTVGWGTRDLVWKKSNGTVMTAAEVKAVRERLRVLSGDTAGGSSIEDCVIGGEKLWPWLDAICEHLPQSTVETRWKAGYAGVVQGNPGAVSNASSALRKWTNNDNFGHAIKAGPMNSDGLRVWVQDPMGFGTYTGQWVPLTEVRQFMRALRLADGTNHTWLIKENSLVSTTTTIDRGVTPRPFTVPKGTRKIGYKLNTASGRYARAVDKTLAVPLTGAGHPVSILQFPAAQKPAGSALLITAASDPTFVGTTFSLSGVTLAPAPGAVAITPAQLEAAKAAALATGVKTGYNEALDQAESLIDRLPRK